MGSPGRLFGTRVSRDAEVADAPRSRPPPGRPARNHRARAQGRAGGYTNALSTDPNLISIDPDGNQFIVGMNSSSPGLDTPLISGFGVTGCAYSQDAGLVVLSGSPSQGQAGVFYSGTEIDSTPVPIAVGGDVAAPGPLVVALPGEGSPAPFPVYLVAGSKVVRVDSDGTTSVAATLPFSLTAYFGITAYAPEPDATPVAAAVTLGWIAIRSRLRRRR